MSDENRRLGSRRLSLRSTFPRRITNNTQRTRTWTVQKSTFTEAARKGAPLGDRRRSIRLGADSRLAQSADSVRRSICIGLMVRLSRSRLGTRTDVRAKRRDGGKRVCVVLAASAEASSGGRCAAGVPRRNRCNRRPSPAVVNRSSPTLARAKRNA